MKRTSHSSIRGICGVCTWHSEVPEPVLNNHAVNGSYHPHVPLCIHSSHYTGNLVYSHLLSLKNYTEKKIIFTSNIHFDFFFFGQSGALWWLGCYIKICIRMQCNSVYLWAFYIENSVPSLKHCIKISGSDWKGTKRHSFGSSKYEISHMLAGRHGHTARTRRHLHLLTLPAF